MEYCQQCGNEIDTKDKFCTNCGSPLNDKGQVSVQKKKFDQLKVDFELKETKILFEKFQDYFSKRDIANAYPLIVKAYKLEPTNPVILANYGMTCFVHQEFDKAIDLFESTIKIDPNNFLALEILMEYNKILGNPDKVEFYFQKLKGLGEEYVEFLLDRANKSFNDGFEVEAERLLKKAYSLDPDNEELKLMVSGLSEMDRMNKEIEKFKGDYDKAREFYQNRLKRNPNDEYARRMLRWCDKQEYGLKY